MSLDLDSCHDHSLATTNDARSEARLLRHLADLAPLHGHSVTTAAIPDVVPELTVVVAPDPADSQRYLLDMADVRARNPFRAGGDETDLIVAPRDRPGQELRGRLEDAPNAVMAIDTLTPHRRGCIDGGSNTDPAPRSAFSPPSPAFASWRRVSPAVPRQRHVSVSLGSLTTDRSEASRLLRCGPESRGARAGRR